MIPFILFLGFFGLFGSEKHEEKKVIDEKNDCYYIESFYFKKKDFILIDRDQDALISFGEAKVHRIQLFLEADIDRNGQIDFKEFLKSMWSIPKNPECKKKKLKESFNKKLLKEFSKIDINKDTKVIPSEFELYGSYSFDLIDVNDDNHVDIIEINDFHAGLN